MAQTITTNKTTTINVRVDEEVKRDVEILLDKLGMNISSAVNMLFRQMLMDEALPFQPKIRRKRISLNEYLEEYHEKDIETVLREAEERADKPVEIDWGKPVGEEIW